MSDFNSVFDKLVKTILWPDFKKFGYKKSNNNFRYYSEDGWGRIVQFQKSSCNSAAEIQFTVNTGFYLSEFERYICNTESGRRFQECTCAVRKRIPELKGVQRDEWHQITPGTEADLLFSRVANDFTHYVHPYLSTVNSREDIYTILLNGHQSGYPIAQIQALYHSGYKEEAKKLFANEFIRSKFNKYYRNTLQILARELELPVETEHTE